MHIMETERVALAGWWRPSEVPGWAMTELTAGDATLAWEVVDQVEAFADLLARARKR